MEGATAKAGPASPGAGEGKSAGMRVQDVKVAQYLEELKPKVLAAFENDRVASLPRPELAVRIGQIVTTDTEQEALNLLDRRNLVAGLINWLLHCSPMAPPRPDRSAPRVEGRNRNAAPTARQSAESKANGQGVEHDPTVYSETVEEAKQTIQPLVMDRLDVSAASQLPRDELSHQLREIVAEVLSEEKLQLNGSEQTAVVELLLDDMLGLGPLEPLLADDAITDIMVNGPYQTYVERGGKLEVTDVKFRNNEHVLNIARRIVSIIGRRVDETSPLVDARLQDGSRVNIIIPPLAIDGPAISIRKFAKKSITLDVMNRQNNISDAMATVLKIASRSRLNIVISGGTGSGKTTLLNAMSQMIEES